MATTGSLPPDVNKGPEILLACGICVALALLMVVVRIFVRVKLIQNVGWDDYCIIAAMTVVFVEMMIIIPEVHLGAGRHWQYIKPESNVPKGLHLNFVTQPLCLIALVLTKVSVGLFLLRLTPSKTHIRLIWGLIILTVLSWAGNFLTVFFQCRPLALTWGGTTEGKCIPPASLKFAAFFNSSFSALTDLLFALLPIPLLWNLQMNNRTKFAIAAILSLGRFTCASAIVKMLYLSSYGSHGDFLYDSSELTIWTTVEICTAIVAACAPCLKPLLREILQSSVLRSSRNKSTRAGYVKHGHSYEVRGGAYGNSRSEDKRPGVQLGYLGRVTGGDNSDEDVSRSESQEQIVRPFENGGISKTVSVSVV